MSKVQTKKAAPGRALAPPRWLMAVGNTIFTLLLTFLGLTAITFVIGRVMPVGGQPMQIFGGVYYNPEEKDDNRISAEWTFKFQIGWLFPQ